jgi:hypothetical protein
MLYYENQINNYVNLNKWIHERGIIMEELAKQVKFEMLRTLLWLVIALGLGVGVYYLVW